MPDKLKVEFPAQGWRQFLTARNEMLDAYDRARQKAKARKVEVFHGNVGEAELRKWLSSFLPKKYGVTPGYVVSPGRKSTEKAPHFDVIIYDRLESPVLWIDDSPDSSDQGRSQAIPVEHVRCVIEVKSKFNTKNVRNALDKLKELLPLMASIDNPGQKYKLHLPFLFFCGLVFFEMEKQQMHNEPALKMLIEGHQLRNFFGGIILRGEGHKKDVTGRLNLIQSESPTKSTIKKGKNSLLDGFSMTDSTAISDDLHLGSLLYWAEPHFSQFGFDLIAMMQGTYEVGRLSSFQAFGTSDWEEGLS